MRKYSAFLVTVVLLPAILIVGSQGRAGAAPLALGHPEKQTSNPVAEGEQTPNPVAEGELTPNPVLKGTCVPTLADACLQGNRFRVEVKYNGYDNAYVAASGPESAVFYFYGSSGDWQVLVKVLNGCGSTNYWWVFAAGATSTTWSVLVVDTVTQFAYTFSEACPLEDKYAIACP